MLSSEEASQRDITTLIHDWDFTFELELGWTQSDEVF
jgi:hypothetical protein